MASLHLKQQTLCTLGPLDLTFKPPLLRSCHKALPQCLSNTLIAWCLKPGKCRRSVEGKKSLKNNLFWGYNTVGIMIGQLAQWKLVKAYQHTTLKEYLQQSLIPSYEISVASHIWIILINCFTYKACSQATSQSKSFNTVSFDLEIFIWEVWLQMKYELLCNSLEFITN